MATQFSARRLWSRTFSVLCAGSGLVAIIGGLWVSAFVLIGFSAAREALAVRYTSIFHL